MWVLQRFRVQINSNSLLSALAGRAHIKKSNDSIPRCKCLFAKWLAASHLKEFLNLEIHSSYKSQQIRCDCFIFEGMVPLGSEIYPDLQVNRSRPNNQYRADYKTNTEQTNNKFYGRLFCIESCSAFWGILNIVQWHWEVTVVIEMVVGELDDREVHKVAKVVTRKWRRA